MTKIENTDATEAREWLQASVEALLKRVDQLAMRLDRLEDVSTHGLYSARQVHVHEPSGYVRVKSGSNGRAIRTTYCRHCNEPIHLALEAGDPDRLSSWRLIKPWPEETVK